MSCGHSGGKSSGCLLTCSVLFLYSLVLWIVKWIRRPRQKITVNLEENHLAISAQKWEWEAESKKNEREIQRFELSQPDGESLFVELIDEVTHLECHVLLYHNGVNYTSDRFIAHQTEDPTIYQCGPLLVDIRDPFRCTRIVFRGEMRDNNGDYHFVSICGWFKPTSDARYFYFNLQPKSLFHHFLRYPYRILCNIFTFESIRNRDDVVQWGQLHCEVTVGKDTITRRYRGLKQRIRDSDIQREDTISVYLKNGHRMFWKSSDLKEHSLNVSHGISTHVDQQVSPMSIENSEYVYNAEAMGLVNFRTDKNEQITIAKMEIHSKSSFTRSDGSHVEVTRLNSSLVGNEGLTFIVQTKASFEEALKVDITRIQKEVDIAHPLDRASRILPFSHTACRISSLAGGKGSNLAKLTAMQNCYNVPRGIVITTTAYDEHLQANPNLKKLIEDIGANGISLEESLSIGEKIEMEFVETRMSDDLRILIENSLDFETGTSLLAVRSSAVGEDGADLSSAGQLESYLNINVIHIEEKVKECWASNFRREVISYRRANGQSVNPPMAVVIQAMVNGGTAGVMFTCDPVRCDPTRFVINAVIGMGEDIVSGAVTPDTVVVSKRGEIIEKPSRCCIDEELLGDLMKIGLYLESAFGKPQDIEFVVKHKRINVVQSRNVTGLDRESQFELLTEFDSATLTDSEIMTTANVGEVMPRPQYPLGYSATFMLYEKALCKIFLQFTEKVIPRHTIMSLNMTRQKVFFNLGEIFLRQWQVLEKDPISEYVIGGEKMLTAEMYQLGRSRYTPAPAWFPIYRLGFMIYTMFWGSSKALKSAEEVIVEMERLERDGDIGSLMKVAEQQRELLLKTIYFHSTCSSCSSFTYIMVAMIIRGSEHGDLTADMLSDFATVCGNSSSEVISADVPSSLKKIAKAIAQSELRSDFELLEGEIALRLLSGHQKIGPLVQEFFKKHGHRGPFELDVNACGWQEKPELLITTLKTMLSDPTLLDVVSENVNVDVIDQLKNKPKGLAKHLMRYMVKQTHRGVAMREHAKNFLVKGTVSLRRTLRQIGVTLYQQGLLPEPDLFYYLTLSEIDQLVRSGSARLVTRAKRRRTIYEKQCDLQYKNVYWGNVEPLDNSSHSTLLTVNRLAGTTVCEGKIVGRARVAKTLEEAQLTKPGEILITRFTDICWSPFFPIIKGIVTEIGGLLSHGAVVAREYGIPSLIAVKHATDVFKTGDLVELDASNSTISKVQEKEKTTV